MKIHIDNISKSINEKAIIKNVTADFESGKIYGISGYNGSGKTMLMRLIIGLISPDAGEIRIDDKVLKRDFDFVPRTGMLIETPAFIGYLNAYENLRMLSSGNGDVADSDIRDALNFVGLDGVNDKVKKYSLGMKQRLGIAMTFFEKPDLLVLDEPTNAMDEAGVEIVKKIILSEKERGALVIMSCHDKEILRYLSDYIYYIDNGEIIRKEDCSGEG